MKREFCLSIFQLPMAGHNKWSKIKRLKGANDAKRGKIFSRFAREIALAARQGGGDLDMNYRLRSVVQAAKAQNMPNDNIERAIQKGTGDLEGETLEEITYEGYGPGGVAIMAEIGTDNRNRSAADLRSIFSKNNGNLASSGSVGFLFEHRGEIVTTEIDKSEEEMLELVLDTGAEELNPDGKVYQILTAPDQLQSVAEALRDKGIEIESQKLIYIPQNTTKVEDASVASQLMRLLDALEDYEDTLNVYCNFEMEEDLLETAQNS